jgi:hypothetical protein
VAIEPDGTVSTLLDGTAYPRRFLGIVQLGVDLDDRLLVGSIARVDRLNPDGSWTNIIDHTGDGYLNLGGYAHFAPDGAGNLLVYGDFSGTLFRVRTDGTVSAVSGLPDVLRWNDISPLTDGSVALIGSGAWRIDTDGVAAVLPLPNLYPDNPQKLAGDPATGLAAKAASHASTTLFVAATGEVETLLDENGVGSGHRFWKPTDMVATPDGALFVSGRNYVFRITPNGAPRLVYEGDVDHLALGPDGSLYAAAHNATLRFDLPECEDGHDNDGDGYVDEEDFRCSWSSSEQSRACGLGPEVAALMLVPLALRRARPLAA